MKIILNGKSFETQYLRLFEIRDKYFDSACITILNGFQTSENLTVKDGDVISIIKKGDGALSACTAQNHFHPAG